MAEIRIERNPSEEKLKELGVFNWPIWEKEESEFPWHYDEPETCYFLEGEVIVTPESGEPVRVQNPQESEEALPVSRCCPGELDRGPVRRSSESTGKVSRTNSANNRTFSAFSRHG